MHKNNPTQQVGENELVNFFLVCEIKKNQLKSSLTRIPPNKYFDKFS